jgi:hypothetical protein
MREDRLRRDIVRGAQAHEGEQVLVNLLLLS